MNCKVSVCICTCCRPKLLAESLKSVTDQTFIDMDIYILDNSSDDKTKEVVALEKDNRITYIKHPSNIGCFGNWNYALDHVQTDYVIIFHDDDRMFPWMVEKLVAVLDANPDIGFAASSRNFIMGSSSKPKDKLPLITRYNKKELVDAMILSGENPIVCPSVIFRKSVIDNHKLRFNPEVGAAADLYFWMQANLSGVPVCLVDTPLLEYRTHTNSGTNQLDYKKWAETYKKIDDLLVEHYTTEELAKTRETFVSVILTNKASSIGPPFQIGPLNELRQEIKGAYAWKISDIRFRDAVVMGFLGSDIQKYGRGEISFYCIWKKVCALKKVGISMPFKRKVKWFLKYAIAQRLLNYYS